MGRSLPLALPLPLALSFPFLVSWPLPLSVSWLLPLEFSYGDLSQGARDDDDAADPLPYGSELARGLPRLIGGAVGACDEAR